MAAPLLFAIIILGVWIVAVIGMLSYVYGAVQQHKEDLREVDEILSNYYPISPKPEITGFKYMMRDKLGIEQPPNVRRPY